MQTQTPPIGHTVRTGHKGHTVRRRGAATALSCVLGLLAACAGAPPQRAVQMADPTPVRAFAARGYSALEQIAVSSSLHVLQIAGQPVQLLLLRAERAAAVPPVPLVLYLPGLGETVQAGAAWRAAWASAGYAVLSVQALADDATAFQSDLAREGAFRTLGQRHYSGAQMARRVQVLASVLAEVQGRATAGDASWQGIAWDHVAVAGFDLGAYTALAVAGEQVRGAEGLSPGLGRGITLRAAIALSPYVNVSEGGLATRYQSLRGPVLSITSDADLDPLGLVAGAAQRQAPFEYAPAGDQLLLTLQGLAHARLNGGDAAGQVGAARQNGRRGSAGSDTSEGGEDSASRGRSGGGGSGGGGTGGGGAGGHRRGGSAGGAGGGAEGSRMASTRRNAGADSVTSAGLSPTAVQLRLIAAQDISTAFLDAHLRDDPLARDWLQTKAPRWLGAAGELRRK